MEKSTVLAKSLLLAAFAAPLSIALEDRRLWLPTQYQQLFLDLKAAATAAEATDRCITVVQGTIDIDRSTATQPIYRILCRQENGLTYNQMVDGKSLEVILPPQEDREDERKNDFWQQCEAEFTSKTRLMRDVGFGEVKMPPEPVVFSKEQTIYSFKFESKDAYGASLRYVARCAFDENGVLSFKIASDR